MVSDRDAVRACLDFRQDHGVLVEPACGASLSVVYNRNEALGTGGRILVIVCGGTTVNMTQLEAWDRELPQAFDPAADGG